MNFTDRTTYLAAVAEWKTEYAALTVEIRKLKLAFKDSQRAYAKHPPYDYRKEMPKAFWEDSSTMSKALRELNNASFKAQDMLEDRAESKLESQRQYLKARAQAMPIM